MNTAWEAEHRRSAVVRRIITRLNESQDGVTSLSDVAGVRDAFPDFGQLLVALQRRWEAALGTRVEMLLECGEDELAEDVAEAWRQLAGEQPGLRRVLDTYAGHPALQHAMTAEHRLVAVAAGLACFDTPMSVAADIGERFLGHVWERRPLKQHRPKPRPDLYEPHWAALDRARLAPGPVPQIAHVPAGPYK